MSLYGFPSGREFGTIRAMNKAATKASHSLAKSGAVITPGWPDQHHYVTELLGRYSGPFSPYGEDATFPDEQVAYVHPYTRINK